jgi:maltoporin
MRYILTKTINYPLGEYRRVPDPYASETDETPPLIAPKEILNNYDSYYGFALKIRHLVNFKKTRKGPFNDFSVAYGTRIVNDVNGAVSQTWTTLGVPDTLAMNFKGAYSVSAVELSAYNTSKSNTINPYVIFKMSKDAGPTNGLSKTYFSREFYTKKSRFYYSC